MNALYFLCIVAVIVVGFVALGRWHQRRAWRETNRMARRYMERRRGR